MRSCVGELTGGQRAVDLGGPDELQQKRPAQSACSMSSYRQLQLLRIELLRSATELRALQLPQELLKAIHLRRPHGPQHIAQPGRIAPRPLRAPPISMLNVIAFRVAASTHIPAGRSSDTTGTKSVHPPPASTADRHARPCAKRTGAAAQGRAGAPTRMQQRPAAYDSATIHPLTASLHRRRCPVPTHRAPGFRSVDHTVDRICEPNCI